MPPSVSLVIPAYNEASCIGPLFAEIPPGLVEQVIVVDNGSTDGTGEIARRAGARVVVEPRRGYGYACAAGAAAAESEIIVFMDGDGSFIPPNWAVCARYLRRAQSSWHWARAISSPCPLAQCRRINYSATAWSRN